MSTGSRESRRCSRTPARRSASIAQRTGFDDDRHRTRAILCIECFDLLDSLRDPYVTIRRTATLTTTRPVDEVARELVEHAWVKRELAELPMRLEPSG